MKRLHLPQVSEGARAAVIGKIRHRWFVCGELSRQRISARESA